jgi:hypothetical protein
VYCVIDGERLKEHPIYADLLFEDICPYVEFPCLCPVGDYSITLAFNDWDLDTVTAHILGRLA